MFSSIRPWINVPYAYRPFVKRTGAGTKQFGESINSLCYPVSDNKLITDSMGADVVSTTQLYVEGSEAIKVTDNVIFEGSERPVLRIASYYKDGVPDIKVVYL